MKNIKYLTLLFGLIAFVSCNEPEDVLVGTNSEPEVVVELPVLTTGSADFSNYVALGASFTAGFTDGAVFIAAQENSFPNILSKQFANAGGGAFTQPLMNDNIGGLVFGTTVLQSPRFYFDFVTKLPVPLEATPTTDVTVNLGGVFNNVGVPGAKSTHIDFNGYAALNPYFGRMATSPSGSMLEYAIDQNPTFFTLSEIGGNDVLGYARSGGDGTDPITPTATFDFVFTDMVNQLTNVCPQGVITNVPYITDLPHFTRVPYNPVPLDAATAGAVNNAYAAYNAGVQSLVGIPPVNMSQAEADSRMINFTAATNNAVVIMDESLSNLTIYNAGLVSMRQATADDLIVLLASSFIGTLAVPGNPLTVNGVAVPLADKWVLIPSEQLEIKNATDAYNAKIASVASEKGLALVDLNAILTQASSVGVTFDNYKMDTNIVTGGLVSLDGIHLTARGYAFMANKFLAAIDATYGSNFVASGNVVKAGVYPTNYSSLLR